MSKSKSWFNRFAKDKQRGIDSLNEGRLYNEFSLLAMNRFKWENLPNNIESRHIEKFLYNGGQVAFFNDDNLGLMCLPCQVSGNLNHYGDPIAYQVTGEGQGYSKLVKVDDCVRILANDKALPPRLQVQHYSTWLDMIEKTMFMNLKQQKYPYIIPTTKENQLSLKNFMNDVENFEEMIFIDKSIENGRNDEGIKVLQTGVPYLLENLQKHKNDVTNELLSWLGLNNTNNDKKERLLVDEINVNNNHILMNLDIEYKNRLKACEEINKKFGLNITVVKTIEELEVDFVGQLSDNGNTEEGE